MRFRLVGNENPVIYNYAYGATGFYTYAYGVVTYSLLQGMQTP